MAKISSRLNAAKWLLPIFTAGSLAACAASSSGPRQVHADNPSVTFNYRTDQDLVEASQRAENYCAQYQSIQRTARITNNTDGSNTVVFDCIKMSPPTTVAMAPAPASPAMTYTYRTDQELLDDSRLAEAYCSRSGAPMTSSIVTNANGTKTVTFQCVPR